MGQVDDSHYVRRDRREGLGVTVAGEVHDGERRQIPLTGPGTEWQREPAAVTDRVLFGAADSGQPAGRRATCARLDLSGQIVGTRSVWQATMRLITNASVPGPGEGEVLIRVTS